MASTATEPVKIHAYFSWPHYFEHIYPFWRFLPEEHQGVLLAASQKVRFGCNNPDVVTKKTVAYRNAVLQGKAPVVVAAHADLRRMGSRPVVFVEHGAGQTYLGERGVVHGGYSGGAGRENVQFFLCPSETVLERNLSAYPNAVGAAVGSPRLDELFAKRKARLKPVQKTVCISFHWDCKVSVESGTAFPFFQDQIKSFVAEAHANNVRVIGHGHPKAWFSLKLWWESLGVTPVASWSDVVEQADVYVADNSSTMFEAAALGVPVVVLESPAWRKNVEHGLRFWEFADVGPTVTVGGGLWAAVEASETQRWRLRRGEVARAVYAVQPGLACESSKQAALAITEWLRRGNHGSRARNT